MHLKQPTTMRTPTNHIREIVKSNQPERPFGLLHEYQKCQFPDSTAMFSEMDRWQTCWWRWKPSKFTTWTRTPWRRMGKHIADIARRLKRLQGSFLPHESINILHARKFVLHIHVMCVVFGCFFLVCHLLCGEAASVPSHIPSRGVPEGFS